MEPLLVKTITSVPSKTATTTCANNVPGAKAETAPPAPRKTTGRPPRHPEPGANHKQWWQRSIAQRTTKRVQADLEMVTAKSPFLQRSTPSQNPLAYFDRSEIRTGCLLGRGGFSVAYEIVAFELDNKLSSEILPEYQAIRESFAAMAVDPDQTLEGILAGAQGRVCYGSL
jgi:hypothetical protein